MYCVEAHDLPDATELSALTMDADVAPRPVSHPDHAEGTALAIRLHHEQRAPRDWPYDSDTTPAPVTQALDVVAIPYHAWGNHEPGPMRVWMPVAAHVETPEQDDTA